jgi:hypothetical protein
LKDVFFKKNKLKKKKNHMGYKTEINS